VINRDQLNGGRPIVLVIIGKFTVKHPFDTAVRFHVSHMFHCFWTIFMLCVQRLKVKPPALHI